MFCFLRFLRLEVFELVMSEEFLSLVREERVDEEVTDFDE
jgi:hypothetical protein